MRVAIAEDSVLLREGLVRLLGESGFDVVGQSGDADDLSEDLGSQYTLDLLTRFSLSDAQMFELFDYCRSRGIMPLCTPWDVISVLACAAVGAR